MSSRPGLIRPSLRRRRSGSNRGLESNRTGPPGAVQRAISYKYPGQALSRGPAWTTTGPGRSPACDRQAAGWLKVATSRPNASMWSLIEKPTTAPRVVAGRPRLGTSSANTDNR